MKFYSYIVNRNLIFINSVLPFEPCGSDGKMIFELKTVQGAIRRCTKLYTEKEFKLFTYTNFYDNKTFKEIKVK